MHSVITEPTSGLDLLTAIAAGRLPPPPAADLLRHLGRTQANAAAEIVGADGTVHVQGMATCRILAPVATGPLDA